VLLADLAKYFMHNAWWVGGWLLAYDVVCFLDMAVVLLHALHIAPGQQHVDATSEFAIVVQYQLGGHNIVMAAEIDAVAAEGSGPIDGQPYVELKTYRFV
jgi:hypothetical protein